MERTKEEQKIINNLNRLAKKWPKSLWLFCDGNGVRVMRCGKNGEHVITSTGAMNPDYMLASINIDNDGGDW